MQEQIIPESLETALWNFLKDEVPKIKLSSEDWSVGTILNKASAHEIIYKLTRWLFGDDPDNALKDLQKLNNPSLICGHVFRPGEATYTCKQCAVDPTCVFCQRCFRQSEHKSHQYKMHSSNGGGCCDCGDTEAWKSCPSCAEHTKTSDQSHVDVRENMQASLLKKLEEFFAVILAYVAQVLTLTKSDEMLLPSKLLPEEGASDERHAAVVFNDESHTFDYVITVLQRAVSCTNNAASDFATLIDREGRSMIRIGTTAQCKEAKDIVVNGPPHFIRVGRNASPLRTYVMHTDIIAHQDFSLHLLAWLSSLAQDSEALRLILSDALLAVGSDKPNSTSVLTQFMLADAEMWKVARNGYEKLLMSSVLLQTRSKKEFGVQYTRVYQRLIGDFLRDDQDHSVSITAISVQLFTVPTIAHYLVTNENLLTVILDTITNASCISIPADDDPLADGYLQLDKKKMKKNFQRLQYCFYDMRYVLTNVPTAWDPAIKSKFVEFFKSFVALIGALEGLDAVVRKTDRHLEHEPEWETGVTLQMRFIPLLKQLYRWCSSDNSILLTCIRQTVARLASIYGKDDAVTTSTVYNGGEYALLDYDITAKPTSVHYPLTRVLAALLVHFGKRGLTDDASFSARDVMSGADRALRSLALCAQVRASAWRRNGISLINQVYYAREYRCRSESFDRDVQLLQVCAALNDPNHVIVAILHRFNLLDAPDKFDEQHTVTLYEELVTTLVYVVAERYRPGIGAVDTEQIARREIVHILAGGAKPHSKIHKHLADEVTDAAGWEDVLRQVADYRPSTSVNTVAKYELKADCLIEVSPCFYHYTTNPEQTNALNEVVRRRKAAKQSCVFVPRPAPPFVETFKNTVNLLLCSNLMFLLKDLLLRLLPDVDAAIQWSDKLVEKILYLIGFAVIEERERVKVDRNDVFRFCQRAEEEGLMVVIRRLVDEKTYAGHKDNICWILNASDDVLQRRFGVQDDDQTFQLPTSSVDGESFVEKTWNAGVDMLRQLADRSGRKAAADERRRALLAQMASQQRKFVARNRELLAAVEVVTEKPPLATGGNLQPSSLARDDEVPVCFSLDGQLASLEQPVQADTCILCQDDSRTNDDCLVLAAFVQVSSVLSKDRSVNSFKATPLLDMTNPCGVYVSTCSHVTHFTCWQQYFDTVKSQQVNRRMRRFFSSFSTTKNEFLCPLCSRLSNCVIPIVEAQTITKLRGIRSLCKHDPPILTSKWIQNVEKGLGSGSSQADAWNLEVRVPDEERDGHMNVSMEEWHDAEEVANDDDEEWHDSLDGGERPDHHPAEGALDEPLDDDDDDLEDDDADLVYIGQDDLEVLDPQLAADIEDQLVALREDDLVGNEDVAVEEAPDVADQLIDLDDPLVDVVASPPATHMSRVLLPITGDGDPVAPKDEDSLDYVLPALKAMEQCYNKTCSASDGEVPPDDECLLLWRSVATTFQVIEAVARTDDLVLMAPPSVRVQQTLASIVRCSFVKAKQTSEGAKHHERMLRVLTGGDDGSLLRTNIFATFVHLVFACDSLRHTASATWCRSSIDNDRCLLRLCALAQLVQIIVFIDEKSITDETSGAGDYNSPLVKLFNQVRLYARLPTFNHVNETKLEDCIMNSFAPFVRSCALFMRHVTGVEPEKSLTRDDNLQQTMRYVGLPVHPVQLLDSAASGQPDAIVQRWCSHPALVSFLNTQTWLSRTFPQLSTVNSLVRLDDDYSDIIAKASTFVCPRFHSEDDSVCPTMCLVCGTILCSQSYCCQQVLHGVNVGACSYHAHQCALDHGIFLRARDCTIILLNESRGSYRPAPYLDEHGETDQGLRRGNPLTLDAGYRMKELNLLWLKHEIAETIVREMESNRNLVNIDWTHI